MNFTRIQKWKAAYAFLAPNGLNMTRVAELNLTLQFPVTQTGWNRVEEVIKFHEPGMTFLTLLALTPMQDDTSGVKVQKK